MYEHIAYELRYEHLSSIKHGSICMKAQFILTTLLELFVHIDCEKHSLRVLTPRETRFITLKLSNILDSRFITHRFYLDLIYSQIIDNCLSLVR